MLIILDLLEEELVGVRAVDGGVAARAVAARLKAEAAVRDSNLVLLRMRIAMALQAQESGFTAVQKKPRCGAVRRVTDRAAFNPYGCMFEHEGSVLVHVAARARLPAGRGQRCEILRSVRIVAVGALPRSFIHSMMEGQRELCAHGGVASVAQDGLRLSEEA